MDRRKRHSADFVGIVYVNEDSNTYVHTLDSNNRPKNITPTFHPAVLGGRLHERWDMQQNDRPECGLNINQGFSPRSPFLF